MHAAPPESDMLQVRIQIFRVNDEATWKGADRTLLQANSRQLSKSIGTLSTFKDCSLCNVGREMIHNERLRHVETARNVSGHTSSKGG